MKLTRFIAGVLGMAALVFGVFAIVVMVEPGHIVVGVSSLGSGAYFLAYALTGHLSLFYRRKNGHREE